MDVYGTHPLGLNWYRLLSIYSDLGKKSNSYEKVCDIGTELKTLQGDVVTAIDGINAKLDKLIGAGTHKLSGEDMTELKQAVVDGMKEHVQSSGERCAAPVVCNDESVFFTDGVQEVLASLVREKARVLQQVDMSEMASSIESIKEKIGSGVPLAEDGLAGLLHEWMGDLSNNGTVVANTLKKGQALSRDAEKTFSAILEAMQTRIEDGFREASDRNTPDASTIAARRDALAEAVVAKMRGADLPAPGHDSATVTLDDASVKRIVNAVLAGKSVSYEPQEPDKHSLYTLSTEEIRQMFINKDDDLLLEEEEYIAQAVRYSRYVTNSSSRGGVAYNKNLLTTSQILNDLALRYPTKSFGFSGGIPDWLDTQDFRTTVETWLEFDIRPVATDMYRLAHTYIHYVHGRNQP